jgi:hypothetical protein
MKQKSTQTKCLSGKRTITACLFFIMMMISMGMQAQAVKEYTSAESATLKADLIAGTYDIYELATDGGTYVISGTSSTLMAINKNIIIRAKAGLVVKPILSVSNTSTSTTSAFFIPSVANLIFTLQGIEFNGLNPASTGQPILVKALPAAINCKVIVKDCYIHHFNNVSGNGTIRLDGSSGSSMDIQGNTFDNCSGRILYFYSADADASTANGDVLLKNNTFSNITLVVGNANSILNYKSSTGVPSRGTNATIDHCTFYNFTTSTTEEIFKFRSMSGVISITNSIFDQVQGHVIFAAPAPIVDYCYLAGFDTVMTGTNTLTTAPVYTDAATLKFGLTNRAQLVGGDGLTAGNTIYYGLPTAISNLLQVNGKDICNFRIYPNPASGNISLDYTLVNDSKVNIIIYNINNKVVKIFMNNEIHGAGSYSKSYDISGLAPGMYFARLTTGSISKSVKMIVRR